MFGGANSSSSIGQRQLPERRDTHPVIMRTTSRHYGSIRRCLPTVAVADCSSFTFTAAADVGNGVQLADL